MSFVMAQAPDSAVLPNGHLMTPHDQRRRAALLADSPELSARPPLNAGKKILRVNLTELLCRAY